MLVRTFVGRRLAAYYSQPAHAVVGHCSYDTNDNNSTAAVGAPSTHLQLSRLWGEWHWKRLLRRLYQEQEGHWLTPVELFKPHYSKALANYISTAIRRMAKDEEESCSFPAIDIVELGGGRGTNAQHILDHLQTTDPSLYEKVRYTIFDSSPPLHQLQRETLILGGNSSSCSDQKTLHADKVDLILSDLTKIADGSGIFLTSSDDTPSSTPTVVLAMEVFDNLPHDKIRVGPGRLIEQAEVVQLDSQSDEDDILLHEERFVPLSDSLLKRVLLNAPAYTRASTSMPEWVPSVAFGVLERLGKERSNLSLVVADFDWLPPPDRLGATNENKFDDDDDADTKNTEPVERLSEWAYGEPLVSSMDNVDHECYLRAPPYCDILFPTDFSRLSAFIKRTWAPSNQHSTSSSLPREKNLKKNLDVTIQKQADFLQSYGPEQVNATKSWLTGYTPLLHDFGNCSVLTASRVA